MHFSTETGHPTLADLFLTPPAAVESSALDAIEQAADRVLGEIGIRFQDPDSIERLKAAGGAVEGDVVRLDGPGLRRIIRASAPERFLLRARNPARDTPVGGAGAPVFAPVYGAPDVLADDSVRQRGTLGLYERLVAECHLSPALGNTGQMICVINDIAEADRPLQMLRAHLSFSDKPFMGTVASAAATRDIIDLTAQAVNRPAAERECNLLHLINCTPPLTYWESPLQCLRVVAEAGEASMVSSYMMMGATGPATAAGALIQGYAEVLAGMALAQLWRPGAPVVMGILAWPFDMRSMLPNFGDPVSQSIQLHAGALGRRLGVPVRADGAVTSAKVDDAQAGADGGRVLSAAVSSRAGFVLHAAGWLEQGRCISIDKLRRDAAMISRSCFPAALPCEPPLPLDAAIDAEIRDRLSGGRGRGTA
ncbi:trimethylamine--corrinoid protein Co-methyltransferase [Hoeflea marina]|uniref:Trimethylamine--corrinoid protein Co-methyltransferase n=1 Tax=Hoeflea marina TaxID=274592 RepID=A0A317PJK4_9HYPH|nr:trimethylamine methyltransferase family protein [Hoeflea marina]PWV98739.1 trimethylamine--corrinoid protein Co-methyltransferase [Hoeflea marina]